MKELEELYLNKQDAKVKSIVEKRFTDLGVISELKIHEEGNRVGKKWERLFCNRQTLALRLSILFNSMPPKLRGPLYFLPHIMIKN